MPNCVRHLHVSRQLSPATWPGFAFLATLSSAKNRVKNDITKDVGSDF